MPRLLIAILVGCLCTTSLAAEAPKKWNIVLIGAEDISPNLGCYGDKDAITPNLDKFASQGARFTRCFSHAPVCAPSRSGLITGMYPTTMGSHHMRSTLKNPPPLFTHELLKAGYQVYWPGKTDFNFPAPNDAFTSTADWMKNPPKKPFFAYINFVVTHESQIRAPKKQYDQNTALLKPEQRRDPAKVTLPPYYPDTLEVRKDVATYHENNTAMDYRVGEVLKFLDDQKLADNTIVFFFGDHGWGMTRGKRWLYDSGIRVPFLARWPGKIAPGTVREDLVAFIDWAPTFLSIAGAPIPERMQGQVFLGDSVKERPYVFACRDRMDETFDRIRAVRDKRYKYLRNFYPELPYSQYIDYMDMMPTLKVWRKWNEEGKLNDVQKLWFAPTKPSEELYDTETDPHEIKNLANSPAHQEKLKELRAALDKWIVETKDLGGTPETELIKKGIVADQLSTEYSERLKLHPAWSKASNLPPGMKQ
ncbi:MAG: sulfatase [Planctomycetes bacterium]|nr:sulfatase [Planctomycetota bacterium]